IGPSAGKRRSLESRSPTSRGADIRRVRSHNRRPIHPASERPMSTADSIMQDLARRFGEDIAVDATLTGLDAAAPLAAHSVHRRYAARPVDPALLRLLCACALSAPSKSDLQQRDIVVVEDKVLRRAIGDLIPDMPWIGAAPAFLVFCGNGRRLPQ